MSERREFHRHEVPIPTKVKIESNGKNSINNTRLLNISLGGACFGLQNSVPVGSHVALNLQTIHPRIGKELGITLPKRNNLNLNIHGKVLRTFQLNMDPDFWCLAVKFSSPMEIKGI